MSYITEDGKEIVSIDSNNPDMYQWGVNCKNLKLSEEECRSVFFQYESEQFTTEQMNQFWEGYSSK